VAQQLLANARLLQAKEKGWLIEVDGIGPNRKGVRGIVGHLCDGGE
jgi:hypothetical protein